MTTRYIIPALTLALGLTWGSAARADHGEALTGTDARRVLEAAVGEAHRLGAPGGAIAVVDGSGDLVAFERLDGTFPAASRIAEGKARTAARFRRPTKVFEDLIVDKGRTSMTALQDFTPLQGGVPLVIGGRIVGAVGVSGAASAQQDTEIAVAAAASLAAESAAVRFFSAKSVEEAFAAGAPILEEPSYKIHASTREQAGRSEVHELDTDIFYVLRGSATFVTGGTLVGGEIVAPNEIRGSSIRDGVERKLVAGDLIIIPQGTPHWFRDVKGPFHYYTVKVTGR